MFGLWGNCYCGYCVILHYFQDTLVELCSPFPKTDLLNSHLWHTSCYPENFCCFLEESFLPAHPQFSGFAKDMGKKLPAQRRGGSGQHSVTQWIPCTYLRIWQGAQSACMGFKRKIVLKGWWGEYVERISMTAMERSSF